MGLILCRKNEVRTPLYSKTLATAIYSYEELSILIYENPILATEDLVNEELISFIRDELGMSTFGDWLALQKKRGMKEEDLLIHILEYGDLCLPQRPGPAKTADGAGDFAKKSGLYVPGGALRSGSQILPASH